MVIKPENHIRLIGVATFSAPNQYWWQQLCLSVQKKMEARYATPCGSNFSAMPNALDQNHLSLEKYSIWDLGTPSTPLIIFL